MQTTSELRQERQPVAAERAARRMPDGHRQRLARDETLAAGVPDERLVLSVGRGMLASCLTLDDGGSYVSALHFPGDLVPLARLDAERPVAVRAVTEAEVEIFTEAALRRFFEEDADGGFAFFTAICDHIVRQREAHCIQRRRSVEGRLADFLLALGGHMGVREGQRFRVALPMRRCEIANYLGLRSETLSRVFARWREDGLIEPGELRQITFPNIARLEAMSRDEG